MKIIRSIFLLVLFVAGVVIATQNTGPVTFVYLPQASWSPVPDGASLDLPLFIVVLGCLVVGAALAGFATFIEQVRLRNTARRQTKLATKMTKERDDAVAKLEEASTALEVARDQTSQAERQVAEAAREAANAAAANDAASIDSDPVASA